MGEPATLKADLLFNAQADLGEGPVWDNSRQFLYWVDIEGCSLHRYEAISGRNRKWEFDGMIGAVIPGPGSSLILAHENGLILFDPGTANRQWLNLLTNADPNLRFNDGKCDPFGNIWIGTMDKALTPGAGQLYRLNGRMETEVVLKGTSVSNGMAWSPDHRYFYYIDTPTYEIWQFDYDRITAQITGKKVVVSVPENFGAPDGMTIDNNGKLWVAHWGGHCIRQWDPLTGDVLSTIEVDAPQVTSCCFGGEDLSTLYITTARGGLSRNALSDYPLSGGLFHCRPGVAGLPATHYQLNPQS